MANYSIKAVIGVVTDKMKAGLKGAGGMLKKFGGAAAQAAKDIARAFTQAAGAIIGMGMDSVKVAAKIDAGMREVFTLLPDISAEAKKKMTADMMDLSQKMGKMPADMTKSLYNALSAGIKKENVFSFMEAASKAAIGGVSSTAEAVGALTTVLNGYKMGAEKASDVSDTLFTIIKQGVTTMPELAANIGKVTPIAASLGISFETVGAAFAELTKNLGPGKSAETGTQLKAMFSELSKASMDAFKNFEAASGKTFPDFMKEGGKLSDALNALSEHAKKLGLRLPDMFGSIEAGSAALILAADGSKGLNEQMEAMGEKAGATNKAFKEVSGGVDFAMKQMAVAWIAFKKVVGDSLAPVVKLIMPQIMNTIEMMKKLPWDALAADIANIVKSFLPLVNIFFGLARQIFPLIGPQLKILAAILNATLAPTLAIVARALEWVYENFGWITIAMGNFAGWINKVTGMWVNLIGHFGKDTWGAELRKTIDKVKGKLLEIINFVADWIVDQVPKLVGFMMRILRAFGDFVIPIIISWIDSAIKKLEGSDRAVDKWKVKILKHGKEIFENVSAWIDKMEKKLEKWAARLEKIVGLIRLTTIGRLALAQNTAADEARERAALKKRIYDNLQRIEAEQKLAALKRKGEAEEKANRLAAFNLQVKQDAKERAIANWRKLQRGETMAHWRERNRQYEIAIEKQKEELRVKGLSKKEWEKEQKERKAQAALGLRNDKSARAAEEKRMAALMKASVAYLTKQGKLKFNFAGVPLRADSLAEARKKWEMIQRLRTEGITDRYGKKWFFKTGIDIENINRRITENLMRGGGAPAQQIKRATVEQKKFNAAVKKNPLLAMGGGGKVSMTGGAGAFDPKYQKAIIRRLDIAIQQRGLIYQTLKGKFVNQ